MAMSGARAMLVDMRRAKERILYDDYIAMMATTGVASQQLLFAEHLVLSDEEFALLVEHEVEFTALGFDFTLKQGGEVVLTGIPSNMVGEQVEQLLYELLREVEWGSVAERMRSDMARLMAVKGSRGIKSVTKEQAEMVLQRLCGCENYSFSPSGKAIMAELTVDDIKTKLN